MSETDTSVNGTAPAAEEPCEDCATPGDKLLGALVAVLGVFVLLMAIDMFTGGRVGGMIRERATQ